jgi:hypothetical protein
VGRLLVEIVADFFKDVVGDVVGWIIGDDFCGNFEEKSKEGVRKEGKKEETVVGDDETKRDYI